MTGVIVYFIRLRLYLKEKLILCVNLLVEGVIMFCVVLYCNRWPVNFSSHFCQSHFVISHTEIFLSENNLLDIIQTKEYHSIVYLSINCVHW